MNFLLSFLIISLTSFSNMQIQEKQVEIMLVRFDHISQMDNGTESSNIFSNKKQKEIIGQAHVGVLQDLVEENPTYKITSALDYL